MNNHTNAIKMCIVGDPANCFHKQDSVLFNYVVCEYYRFGQRHDVNIC